MGLSNIVRSVMLAAFSRPRQCAHDDAKGYTFVRGNLVHCKCGESIAIPCMHTRIEQLLPRMFRCVDCAEYRGTGAQ